MMTTFLGNAALFAAQAGVAGGGGDMRGAASFFFLFGGFVSAFALVLAGGSALLLVTVFLVPGVTQRGAEQAHHAPYRSILVGVPVVILLLLLFAATVKARGLVFLTAPLIILVVAGGLAVISQDLGRRVFELSGRSGTRFGRILAGWSIFLGMVLVPFLGWIVEIVLLTSGIGGFLLSLFARTARSTPTPEVLVAANPDPAAMPPEGTT